jgi:hypothetical protein
MYSQVANRLSELLDDVRRVGVDRDDRRELLTLEVTGEDGTTHPARALSDGTLRFLALAVLELDPEVQGVLCLEEPENGIHPKRIPAMLSLLQDIATDTEEAVNDDNPLRQVIVNTHSPAIVAQVPEDSLLVAELQEMVQANRRFKRVAFSYLADTWRDAAAQEDGQVPRRISMGELLSYLNPVSPAEAPSTFPSGSQETSPKRVADRPDVVQLTMPIFGRNE